MYPTIRLRRLRQTEALRALVRETHLSVNDFVLPLFIHHGINIRTPISSMPGQFQISVDKLEEELEEITELGIKHLLLFGIPEKKDELGQDSYADDGIIQTAIATIKKCEPTISIMSDLCFCEYTDHGHCGILTKKQNDYYLDNDKTLELLVKQAISHAKAGADVVAPSGMIDGMVTAIRQGLDNAGFVDLPILSYSAKYASALYGPFRQAALGAPRFGDRSSHMMDVGNSREALRECALDVAEGADMLMVKPAHTYLDIISAVKTTYPHLPLGAYHTSGEFAMIKAAAQNNWLDEKKITLEILTAIKRAGADFIITYFAKQAAIWLNSSRG